ncbi:MAG: ABC transporter ATP-binding protein/permease [Defluviitaleaceae bacterium]|nr:ABC transporter ATP-binding protein/permease [Defluviitaleaceae bacterium]
MTDMQAIKKVFKYVKPYIFTYPLAFLGFASQGFLGPLILSVFMGTVMTAILYSDVSLAINGLYSTSILILVFLLSVGLGLYFFLIISEKITRALKKDLFNAFVKKDIEKNSHTGEGIAAINTEANMASQLYSHALFPIIMASLSFIFSAITILILDIRMGLGVILLALIVFFSQIIFRKPLEKLGKEQIDTNAEAVKTVSNVLEGQAVLRTFDRQQKALVEFDPYNMKLKKISVKRAFIEMWQGTFTTLQGFLTLFLVFGLGGYFVATDSLGLEVLIMIPPLATNVTHHLSSIGTHIANLKPSLVALKRVLQIIEGTESNVIQIEEEIEGYEINIENLSFSYIDSEEIVLENINLQIKENELVAFVGSSGSGKTTLLKTIIGMYEREELPIMIGNTTFKREVIKNWRKTFAYVDQSSKLFDVSIEENLKIVKEDATEEEMRDALKKAGIEEVDIKSKAENMSGGQKQRIAIARALLRNSKILVFDEATSALDSETEKEVLETIEEFRKTNTVLMITHNLKSITTADKIIILDKGKISEIGKHEQLIETNEIYKSLF